jgi:hypothetical protein
MADAVMIPNVGLGLVTGLLAASSLKHVGWGTGTTPPAVGNTALETASAESRTSGTQTQQTTTTTNDTYQVVALITSLSAQAITEVAIFDAATVGNLYYRGTFSAINVSISDSITFTLKTVYDQA